MRAGLHRRGRHALSPDRGEAAVAGIFVSYRRDDAAHVTGRIADALAARVGRENVFVDVDSVAPGEDFVRKIETTIRGSDIFLAVIGANWLSASTGQGQRRIDLPGDFIRLEVGTALAAGVRVIPVLVDGASMPRAEDLPEDIRQLVRHNAVFINHTTFARDMRELIDQLKLPGSARRRAGINPLAMPIGAGAIVLSMLALAAWPKGASTPTGISSSVSLAEQDAIGARWITQTEFKAERGAGGRLSIRADMPYRDRVRDEKRIEGLEFLGSSPLSAPMPVLTVHVTNASAAPVIVSEIQFEVIEAVPDKTPLPVLRESQVDYRRLHMMNEGWGDLDAPRLAISAWGLPESDFDRARKVWRGDISVSEPCAEPSRRIDIAPISIDATFVADTAVFDLEGKMPAGFDDAKFVCAIGELSYVHGGKTETLALRTRISNQRPLSIAASPIIETYDLYLDPDREGYAAVLPFMAEIAAGATIALPVRIYTDKSSDFRLRQSVRTVAGEVVPGEDMNLQIFVTRNSAVGWAPEQLRLMVVPPSAVAAVDKDGVVESVTIDPLGEAAVQVVLKRDLAPGACEKLLNETVPGILAKVGVPDSPVEVSGPSGPACKPG